MAAFRKPRRQLVQGYRTPQIWWRIRGKLKDANIQQCLSTFFHAIRFFFLLRKRSLSLSVFLGPVPMSQCQRSAAETILCRNELLSYKRLDRVESDLEAFWIWTERVCWESSFLTMWWLGIPFLILIASCLSKAGLTFGKLSVSSYVHQFFKKKNLILCLC